MNDALANSLQKSIEFENEGLKIPNVTDELLNSGSCVKYINSRISQYMESVSKFGVKRVPNYLSIECSLEDASFIRKIEKDLVYNNCKIAINYAQWDGYGNGFFTLSGYHYLDGRAYSETSPGIWYGVFYDKPVSRKFYETRWVLQVFDNRNSDDAVSIASLI